jgi:hypothetical protein
MALLADNAQDRAEQLLIVTERLTALIREETRLLEARKPPLAGAEADEKNRLANAYRLELARIKQDPLLLQGAPEPALRALREGATALQAELSAHELALGALKTVSEGLVQAMAEEVNRQRGGAPQYGAGGGVAAASGPRPALIDRSA